MLNTWHARAFAVVSAGRAASGGRVGSRPQRSLWAAHLSPTVAGWCSNRLSRAGDLHLPESGRSRVFIRRSTENFTIIWRRNTGGWRKCSRMDRSWPSLPSWSITTCAAMIPTSARRISSSGCAMRLGSRARLTDNNSWRPPQSRSRCKRRARGWRRGRILLVVRRKLRLDDFPCVSAGRPVIVGGRTFPVESINCRLGSAKQRVIPAAASDGPIVLTITFRGVAIPRMKPPETFSPWPDRSGGEKGKYRTGRRTGLRQLLPPLSKVRRNPRLAISIAPA